jgi:hypothetical protein
MIHSSTGLKEEAEELVRFFHARGIVVREIRAE